MAVGGREQLIEKVVEALRLSSTRFNNGVYEVSVTRANDYGHWQRLEENGRAIRVWGDFVVRRNRFDMSWLLYRMGELIMNTRTISEAKAAAAELVKGDEP